MSDYEIIDTHAHIFPDKIAEKATRAIGDFYDIPMCELGVIDRLLSEGKAIGVSRYVVHSTATTTHQVSSINDYIIRTVAEHREFIGYMTLHPDMTMPQIEEEVDHAIANGLMGVKLHPDFQRFYVDDKKAEDIYSVVEGRLPILFHAGDKRYEYSAPERIAKIAKLYPNLTCIAAHFGGYSCWDRIGCYEGLDNVYFDTSSALFALTPDEAVGYIHTFGADKFFFGVDFPMWKHNEELERFMRLPLTEAERVAILAGNVKRVLKL